MEVKPNRLVHLGYGKYWRSDQIVGLVPIEDDRGPGRRTKVYVTTLDRPIIASRSEQAIRQDMTESSAEEFRTAELRSAVMELLEDLGELSPVLKRMLLHEGGLDVRRWEARLRGLFDREEDAGDQEDLFMAEPG